MIGLIQRVNSCSVSVDGETVSSIGKGLLILLGVHRDDTDRDLNLLARKCIGLRIFSDDEGRMNRSISDIGGEILVVSQFTLLGDVKRGLRPYFGDAAEPERAESYYTQFMNILSDNDIPIQGGVFGAYMHVDIMNDGPVTLPIDTRTML